MNTSKFKLIQKMALILVIETATKNCSLALCENGITLESVDYNDGNFSHAEKLHVLIEEILNPLGIGEMTIECRY